MYVLHYLYILAGLDHMEIGPKTYYLLERISYPLGLEDSYISVFTRNHTEDQTTEFYSVLCDQLTSNTRSTK